MGQNVRTIQYMSYQGFIYTCYLEIPGHIYWRGIEQAINNYLYQCWSTLLKQICVTRPRWVDSEWHIDVCVCVCAPEPRPHPSVANLISLLCPISINLYCWWLWFAVLELNNIYYAQGCIWWTFDVMQLKAATLFCNPGTYGVFAMAFARFKPFFRALHDTNH